MADREQDFRLRCNYGHDLARLLPQCARDILQARPADPAAYMCGWLYRSIDSQLCHESEQRVRTKCKDVAHEMDALRQRKVDHVQELEKCVSKVKEVLGHRPTQKEDSMRDIMARYHRRRQEAIRDYKEKLPRIPLPQMNRTKVGDFGKKGLEVESRLPPIKTQREKEIEKRREDKVDINLLEELSVESRLPPIKTHRENEIDERREDKVDINLMGELSKEMSLGAEAGFENTEEGFDIAEAEFEIAESQRSLSSDLLSTTSSLPSIIMPTIMEAEDGGPSALKKKSIFRPSISGRYNYLTERQMSIDSAKGMKSWDKALTVIHVARQFAQTKRRHEDILNIDQLTTTAKTPVVPPSTQRKQRSTYGSIYGPITDGIRLSFAHPTLGVLGGQRSSIPEDLVHQNMELSDIRAVNCFNLYDPEIYVVCDPIHFLAHDYLSAQIEEMTHKDYGYEIDD